MKLKLMKKKWKKKLKIYGHPWNNKTKTFKLNIKKSLKESLKKTQNLSLSN